MSSNENTHYGKEAKECLQNLLDHFDEEKWKTIFSDAEKKDIEWVEIFLILAMDKSTDADEESAYKKLWEEILQRKLHRKIFNRPKTFVGLLVERRMWTVLQILLNNAMLKPNLRDTGYDGNTLLHHLCGTTWSGNISEKISFTLYKTCMETVLSLGVIDINTLNKNKQTPMCVAIKKNNKEAAKILITSGEVFVLQPGEHQALINLVLLEVPLAAIQVSHDGTLLHKLRYELMQSDENFGSFETSLITFLNDEQTAENEIQKKELLTIFLQEACKQGFTKKIMLLLEKGADPNKNDEYNDDLSAVEIASSPVIVKEKDRINLILNCETELQEIRSRISELATKIHSQENTFNRPILDSDSDSDSNQTVKKFKSSNKAEEAGQSAAPPSNDNETTDALDGNDWLTDEESEYN